MMIDGKHIAALIEDRVREALIAKRLTLSVASVFAGDAADSELYTRRKEEAARRLGVSFRVERLPSEVAAEDIRQHLHRLNDDESVDGYIVQLPLPRELRPETDWLLNEIAPRKDVDGLTRVRRKLFLGNEAGSFAPTPVAAVLTLLQAVENPSFYETLQCVTGVPGTILPENYVGKRATVVSDGDVFGPTLVAALVRGGMEGSVLRSDDVGLADALRESDLVVTAVGKPGCITGDMVRDGVVVIDVGTTLVDGHTRGDVDFESVAPKARALTPVPGGVGPVTVAMLFANALYLKQYLK